MGTESVENEQASGNEDPSQLDAASVSKIHLFQIHISLFYVASSWLIKLKQSVQSITSFLSKILAVSLDETIEIYDRRKFAHQNL